MRLTAGLLPIGPRATIVIQRDSDPETLRLVREELAAIGVTDIRIAHRRPSTARETLIVLGMASDTTVAQALAQAGGTPVTDHEGYALASAASGGAALIVLAGADADGLYYGAQTFRQIVTRGTMPALTIADHPRMAVRGTIEGFYGAPGPAPTGWRMSTFSAASRPTPMSTAPRTIPMPATAGVIPIRQSGWRN
jgi:hyaluronoglucosaminidase